MPSVATENLPAFLTLDQAAQELGCTRQFLESRITAGEIAVFRPSARLVRIRQTEWERWIALFTVGGTSQPARAGSSPS